MVVPVPLPVGVQRHQEQVGARQRLQHRRGAALLEDRVAERPRHPLENGGPREEAKLVRGQVREQLRLQVVGHETVAPGERRRALRLDPPRPDRQRGEIETCGPALGLLGELGDLVVRQVHAGRVEQLARLRLGHAQIVRARSPASGPAPAALPAAAPGCRAPRAPAASPPERVARAPPRRRSLPGRRADAGRRGPGRAAGRSSPERRPGAGRPSPRPTRRATPARRTRRSRAARRGRARPRHTSAGRSDRCPSRRPTPTRTGAATPRPTERAASSCPSPRRRTGRRSACRDRFPSGRPGRRGARCFCPRPEDAASTRAARTPEPLCATGPSGR